jgi:hypothetical protein
LFEKLSLLPVGRVPQAQDIVEAIKDILRRDEHVTPLVETLQKIQSVALDLFTKDMLTRAVQTSPPAPSRPAAPMALPSLAPGGETTTHSRRGLGVAAALALFDAIRQELEAHPDVVLDIDWRLSPQQGNAS